MDSKQQHFTCGNGRRQEITLVATGADMIDLAQRVWDASDEEGVLQAENMAALFPGQARLHTTTLLFRALLAAGCVEVESDNV